jgi:hypothetical protein
VELCNSIGSAWLFLSHCPGSCVAGHCTGACQPGVTQCNGNSLETCNPQGTAWTASSCNNICVRGQCALASLDIVGDTSLDGQVIVTGDVTVHTNATLSTPTGNLTIWAESITVEAGAHITVAATGPLGAGSGCFGSIVANFSDYFAGAGGGGGYGSAGNPGAPTPTNSVLHNVSGCGGSPFASLDDADVSTGSRGGDSYGDPGHIGSGANGGGVIRLHASSIHLLGDVAANGADGLPRTLQTGMAGGGGGSGGAVLMSADELTVNGAVSVYGGAGGVGPGYITLPTAQYEDYPSGGGGGNGVVKLLHGRSYQRQPTIVAALAESVMPPWILTSTSHPDPNAVYNDGFSQVAFSWDRPFPSLLGYYVSYPGSGDQFLSTESFTLPYGGQGDVFFSVRSIDGMSVAGTVSKKYHIQVNSTPPSISSSTHPAATWTASQAPAFSWTFPVSDSNVSGAYWLLDHQGDTLPTASASFLPVTQKQLILPGQSNGIWFFHLIAADTRGALTRRAAHYQVRIGADPGSGSLVGSISDSSGAAIDGAAISINGGIVPAQVSNQGSYNFGSTVPVGTWAVKVDKTGYSSATQVVTIAANGVTHADFVLH